MPNTLADVLSVGVRERTGVRPMLDANGAPRSFMPSREAVRDNLREEFGEETDNNPKWNPERAAERAAEIAAREARRDQPHPRGSAPSRNRPSYRTVATYVSEHGSVFSSAQAVPGDRVISYAFGRVGTVVDGGRTTSGGFYPAVVYDDDRSRVNTDHTAELFAVIHHGATLPPMPWM